jgi:hypothetical protein
MSETNSPSAKSDVVTLKVTRHMNGTHKFVTKEDAMAVPGSSFVVRNVEGVQVVGPNVLSFLVNLCIVAAA